MPLTEQAHDGKCLDLEWINTVRVKMSDFHVNNNLQVIRLRAVNVLCYSCFLDILQTEQINSAYVESISVCRNAWLKEALPEARFEAQFVLVYWRI